MAETQAAPATGIFVWNELATRDPRTALSILTSLFGWKSEEMDMGPEGKYTIFKVGDQRVGGCWAPQGEKHADVPTSWLNYVSVKNADVTVKNAERLGMKVKVPATDIPNVGRFAVFEHAATGVLAILEPRPM